MELLSFLSAVKVTVCFDFSLILHSHSSPSPRCRFPSRVSWGGEGSLLGGRPHDISADGFLLLHLTPQYPIMSVSGAVSQGVTRMMTDRPLKPSHHELRHTAPVRGLACEKWFPINWKMLSCVRQMFLFFSCSVTLLLRRVIKCRLELVISQQRPVVVTLLGAITASRTMKNMKNGLMSHVPSIQFGRLNLPGPFDPTP